MNLAEGDSAGNIYRVRPSSSGVDQVDLAILRELSREQVAGVGNLDPRLSLNEIARRAELPPSTVSKRVRDWEDKGLLAARSIWPNPSLLGARLAGLSVHAPGLAERPGLVDDLGLVDGVLLVLEHVEPWLAVMIAFPDDGALDRRCRLMARIAGVEAVEDPFELAWPTTTEAVSDLQWRLIQALFEHPRAELHAIADHVGVSTRTVSRKLGPLIDGQALWSVFELDFTRWPGACLLRLLVSLAPEAERVAAVKRVREAFPGAVFINNSVQGPRVGPTDVIDLLVALPSAARIPDARRAMVRLDGVEAVESLLPRRIHAFGHWFEPRLREKVDQARR